MTAPPIPEGYYVGAYWGPRKESPEECARRAAVFLNLLAPCDPFLAHWYKYPKSRRDKSRQPLTPPDESLLAECFRRGVNQESGGPPFEDLGFTFSFDNGGTPHDYANLTLHCGEYSGVAPNLCLLTPPRTGANAERVLTAPVLSGVVRSMALAWDPDWAVAASDSYRRLMSETSRGGTFVGWVTYLSRRRGTVPPLPAPVRIEPVEDKGALVILAPDRLTASNPDHVELGRRVGKLLDKAGLLQPIVTP